MKEANLASAPRRWWQRGFRILVKRALDLVIASACVFILSPLLVLVWLLVRFNLGKPALFRQERPGYSGTPFMLYKFRTMTEERDGKGRLLPDGRRLTKLGRVLRRTSIDELPELINVLRGEMSLVGPRPLLLDYLELYTAEQKRRHEMPPGVTGPVQVSGRNALSWKDKFALDLAYVNDWTLRTDLKILSMSLWKVLTREGVSAQG
ncbi:MAG: sugar transferase, partial [Actinomycetota bacterium]